MPRLIAHSYRVWPVVLEATHGCGAVLSNRVVITPHQKIEDEMDTLIHELLHVVSGASELFADEDEEERVVSRMSRGITELLIRNPELGDYLSRGAHYATSLHHGPHERQAEPES